MKASLLGVGLLVTASVTMFMFSSRAASIDTVSPEVTYQSQSVSIEANHPLAMAHQQLEQARKHYNNGEIDAVRKSLEIASKWLQDSGLRKNTKAKDEAEILAHEIKLLKKKIATLRTNMKER